jgi:hypothetical protein
MAVLGMTYLNSINIKNVQCSAFVEFIFFVL